jgi:hypothetical protein
VPFSEITPVDTLDLNGHTVRLNRNITCAAITNPNGGQMLVVMPGWWTMLLRSVSVAIALCWTALTRRRWRFMENVGRRRINAKIIGACADVACVRCLPLVAMVVHGDVLAISAHAIGIENLGDLEVIGNLTVSVTPGEATPEHHSKGRYHDLPLP